MQFLTLDLIKHQCRLELDQHHEDTILSLYGAAAEACVASYLNRRLYTDAVPEDDSNGTVVKDDIRMAMLLVVSFLYENRSETPETAEMPMPITARHLLAPYRVVPI